MKKFLFGICFILAFVSTGFSWFDEGAGSVANVTLSTGMSGGNSFIWNTTAHQTGAQFYVSGATVAGPVVINSPEIPLLIKNTGSNNTLEVRSNLNNLLGYTDSNGFQNWRQYNFSLLGGSVVSQLTWDATDSRVNSTTGWEFDGDTQLNAQKEMRYSDADSSNYVSFRASSTISSNVNFILPAADGTNGQALTTNGSKVLSFTSISGGDNLGNQVATGTVIANFGISGSTIELSGAYTTTPPEIYPLIISNSNTGSGQISQFLFKFKDNAGTYQDSSYIRASNTLGTSTNTKIDIAALENGVLVNVMSIGSLLNETVGHISLPRAQTRINFSAAYTSKPYMGVDSGGDLVLVPKDATLRVKIGDGTLTTGGLTFNNIGTANLDYNSATNNFSFGNSTLTARGIASGNNIAAPPEDGLRVQGNAVFQSSISFPASTGVVNIYYSSANASIPEISISTNIKTDGLITVKRVVRHGNSTDSRYGDISYSSVTTRLNSSTHTFIAGDAQFGNLLVSTGNTPSLSSCGTSPSIVGNDIAGRVTMGTGGITSCTVTFTQTYPATPSCFANNETDIQLVRAVATTTTLTLSVSADFSSDVVNYYCIAVGGITDCSGDLCAPSVP